MAARKERASAKKAATTKKKSVRKRKKKVVRKTTTGKSAASKEKTPAERVSAVRTHSSFSSEKGEEHMEGKESQEQMTPEPEAEAARGMGSEEFMEPGSEHSGAMESSAMSGEGEIAGDEMAGETMGGEDVGMGTDESDSMYDQPDESMDSDPDVGDLQPILVEIRTPRGADVSQTFGLAQGMNVSGFQLDSSYEPVPVDATPDQAATLASSNEECRLVRGFVERDKKEELKRELRAQPNVVGVYDDTKIRPFGDVMTPAVEDPEIVQLTPGAAPSDCPIPPCDCDPRTRNSIPVSVRYLYGG